ncbi:MAG TPA: DUF4296 domain-containing protein [Puia sp.]|nr:DUF4296 domain-containing protein [Puia sp.]
MRKPIAGLIVFFFFVLTGCSDKDSVPYGVLSVNKMCTVMWDMIQADQYAAMLAKDSGHVDARAEHLRLYDQVFRLHDVSREKFQKSYKYYLEHPKLNQVLFDSLSAQGNRLRNEAYTHPVARPVAPPSPAPPATPPVTPKGPHSLLKGALHPRPKGASSHPASLRAIP